MDGANHLFRVLERAALDAPLLKDVPGDPRAPAVALASGDSRLAVIDGLLGALIDVPPNAWLFA